MRPKNFAYEKARYFDRRRSPINEAENFLVVNSRTDYIIETQPTYQKALKGAHIFNVHEIKNGRVPVYEALHRSGPQGHV